MKPQGIVHHRVWYISSPLLIFLVGSFTIFASNAVTFHASLEVKLAFRSRGGDLRQTQDMMASLAEPQTPFAEKDVHLNLTLTESSTADQEDSSAEQQPIAGRQDDEEEYPKSYYFPLCQQGDGSESDPDGIPGRFLRMQKGDREKALAAFQNTMQWRADHEVDTILGRPHPKFLQCKAVFPHYFCGRDPNGHVVFVQRPGAINMALAKINDVSTNQLLMHYVYVLEYCWNIIEPRPDQTMTSVIDLKGVHFRSVMEQIPFVKEFVGMMSSHFPQRSHKTLLVNTPRWFGTLYKLLSPLLRESTKAKIEIHHRGKKQDAALQTYLGDLAPAELMSHHPKHSDKDPHQEESETGPNSPMEQELRAFVMARLGEAGEDMQVIVS